jgi:glycosyltransferase involved in cell wall biosynthesis
MPAKLLPFKLPNRTEPPLRPGISLCMIVKNEDGNLERCLRSVDLLVNEIIIVDTGSTDKTKKLAKKIGSKVLDFVWEDDFAKARNFSLKQATHQWILVLDADEAISEIDHDKIRQAITFPFDAYLLNKRSYVNRPDLGGFQANDHLYEEATGYLGWCNEPNHLLFRNDKRYFYEDIIHETVGKSLAKAKARVGFLDVPIHHFGRWDMSKKEGYYFEMCRKRAEIDNSPDSWYTLGAHYDWFNKDDDAIKCFEKVLEMNPEYHKARFGLGLVYFRKEHWTKSEWYLKEFLEKDDDPLALAKYIQVLFLLNHKEQAIVAYDEGIQYYKEKMEMTKAFLPSKVLGRLLISQIPIEDKYRNKATECLELAKSLVPDDIDLPEFFELLNRK